VDKKWVVNPNLEKNYAPNLGPVALLYAAGNHSNKP
jgi:hypothetical protein